MDLTAAHDLAIDLMDLHGDLRERGWRFEFDNAVKRLGSTRYGTKRITMSRHMVGAADEELVRQTMLHEIAHVLAGPTAHHGPEWRRMAASIGYTGKRTSKNPYVAEQRRGSGMRAGGSATLVAGPVTTKVSLAGTFGSIGGTSGHRGTRVRVLKVNRTRYLVERINDGTRLTVPFALFIAD